MGADVLHVLRTRTSSTETASWPSVRTTASGNMYWSNQASTCARARRRWWHERPPPGTRRRAAGTAGQPPSRPGRSTARPSWLFFEPHHRPGSSDFLRRRPTWSASSIHPRQGAWPKPCYFVDDGRARKAPSPWPRGTAVLAIGEGGRTVGAGTVVAVLDEQWRVAGRHRRRHALEVPPRRRNELADSRPARRRQRQAQGAVLSALLKSRKRAQQVRGGLRVGLAGQLPGRRRSRRVRLTPAAVDLGGQGGERAADATTPPARARRGRRRLRGSPRRSLWGRVRRRPRLMRAGRPRRRIIVEGCGPGEDAPPLGMGVARAEVRAVNFTMTY